MHNRFYDAMHNECLAFLFPGQGAYFNSCLVHIEGFSREAAAIGREIDSVARDVLGKGLKEACGDDGAAALAVRNPMALQLALYAAACMTAAILEQRGVWPQLAIGHSFGEIAALAHAGAFDWADGARIVCDRTEALAACAPKDGAMLAVALPATRTEQALANFSRADASRGLVVAVENHDGQTIVSGPRARLEEYAGALRAQGVSTTFLASPYGFHNPALMDAARDFERRLRRHRARRTLRYAVWSPILERPYVHQDDVLKILAQHLVMPVRFSAMAVSAYDHGVRAIVECGASDALGRIVKRALQAKQGAEIRIYSVFPNASATAQAAASIARIIEEAKTMNMIDAPTAFEKFWRERSPYLLMHIKTEFEYFLASQHIYGDQPQPVDNPLDSWKAPVATPPAVQPAAPVAAVAAAPAPSPRPAVGKGRQGLLQQLAALYAEAMEYPVEVFTETAELEAELGIDSVKQTEIMGRASQMFGLPPLPPDIRLGDYRTLGQITDLILTHQDRLAAA